MSEHKELVQDLQDCRFSFGAGVALKPRDKVNPFDKLMLDSLEKAIAVLQGSTAEKVCKWEPENGLFYSKCFPDGVLYKYTYCSKCGGRIEQEKER